MWKRARTGCEPICIKSIRLNIEKKKRKEKRGKKTLLYITLKEIVKEEKPKRGILEQKLSVLFYDNVQLREWIER